MAVVRTWLLATAMLAWFACSRANQGPPIPTAATGAPQYCAKSESGPPFMVCKPYYYECTHARESEERFGRRMGPCKQQ